MRIGRCVSVVLAQGLAIFANDVQVDPHVQESDVTPFQASTVQCEPQRPILACPALPCSQAFCPTIPACIEQMATSGFFLSLTPFVGQAGIDDFVVVKKVEQTLPIFHSKSEYMNFHWAPGFQIGLGYNFGDDIRWVLNANWMWFYNTGSKKGSVPVADVRNVSFISNFFIPLVGSRIQSFRAKYNIHYNVFDLDAARTFAPWARLTIQPHLGLRGASILQQFGNTNFGSFELSTGTGNLIFFDNRVAASQKFYGAGLRAGTDLVFYMNDDWGLYGNFFAALLAGKIFLHQKVDGANFAANPDELTFAGIRNRDQFWTLRPNLETELGFKYGTYFGCEKMLFTVEVGYLMSYWFNLCELYNSVLFPNTESNVFTFSVRTTQDLFVQGAKAQFRMDF